MLTLIKLCPHFYSYNHHESCVKISLSSLKIMDTEAQIFWNFGQNSYLSYFFYSHSSKPMSLFVIPIELKNISVLETL